jgi:hypothetical protein
MMENTSYSYSVLLVPSTSHAVRAEKQLLDSGISCKLIPVPKTISSNCGVCIRFRTEDRRRIMVILGQEKLNYDDIVNL